MSTSCVRVVFPSAIKQNKLPHLFGMASGVMVPVGVFSLLVMLALSSHVPGSASSRPEETCVWSPFAKSRKVYHLQLVGDDGQNIALRLIRDPERPILDIRMGASWSAWLPAPWFADDVSELEVEFAPLEDNGTEASDRAGTAEQTRSRRRAEDGNVRADSSEIAHLRNLTHDGFLGVDILTHYRYIRRVRLGVGPDGVQRPNGIEIGLEDGRGTIAFAGGAYYPEDVSKRSLWNVMTTSLLPDYPDSYERLPALLHGRGIPRDAGPVPPGRDSMFGLRASDLPQVATSLESAASPLFSSISSGISVNVFDVTSSFSVFGVVTSSYTSLTNLDQRWDDLWQMELVASEKFFDKLWCSGIFTVCPGPEDVIVPPGKECPVLEPLGAPRSQ